MCAEIGQCYTIHELRVRLRILATVNRAISDATYYNWTAKYGGMSTSDLERLKETEIELSQYKKMYAELAHENYALKDLIEKKL